MEGSFRLLFAETNLQTRETSRSPPIRENIRKGIIYLWKFRCVEREIMDHAWSNSFLFLEKKNFNVSRSMFRIYFRKFVVYNGYKCYDDRKINSRRVASYSNIYLRNLNINRRNACLLPLDRWYLYASTHLFQICTVVRAKQIFLLLLNFEILLILLESNFTVQKRAKIRRFEYFLEHTAPLYLRGGERKRREERYVSFTTLRNYFDSILIPRTINTAVYVILYLTCWFVE